MTSKTSASPRSGIAPRIDIRRMDAYDRNVRDEVIEVILDGFYSQLSFFTKDRRKLAAGFRNEIRAPMFYVAELDGHVVGVLACSDNTGRALVANKTSLRRGLGYVVGTIAAHVLAREFNSPLPYDDDTGYIEWVATSEHARGRGVSTALFHHVIQHLHYQALVLEVVDHNENARHLYTKLGFVEYKRIPAKGIERRTFKERIHMRWVRNTARTPPDTSTA